jgi:hypothetical protein
VAANLSSPINESSATDSSIEPFSASSSSATSLSLKPSALSDATCEETFVQIASEHCNAKAKSKANTRHDSHESPPKYSEAAATIGRDWVKVHVQPRPKAPASPQCHSLHVIEIKPNGSCATDSQLKVGDRLLQINGVDVNRLKVNDVIRLLRTSRDPLQLIAIDTFA